MRPGPAKDAIKRKALVALKRRKVYEQQQTSLVNQGFNLDQTVFVQGQIKDTQTTMAAMKAANVEMKTQFKQMDPDDVYDMRDDMQEMFDQHYEIQEALSRTYETPEGFDDEELEAELDALGDMEIEEEPPAWLSNMPSVEAPSPTTAQPVHGEAIQLK